MPLPSVQTLNNANEDALDLGVFVNGTAVQSAVNRAGNRLRTLLYYQARFEEALARIGYEAPVLYSAGIALTRSTQTVEYQGKAYAPVVAALPFTTSGTFETANFRLIEGATIEALQTLIANLASGAGADLVGFLANGDGAILKTVGDTLIPRTVNYGGVSDGVTDDTAAVALMKAEALVDGKPVLIPDNTLHNVDLNGVLRIPTVYYDARDVDCSQEFMARAYRGETIFIDAEGDSTQYGANVLNLAAQVARPSPEWMQYVLRQFYGNNNITVNNNGVSSSSIRQMLEGSAPYTVPFETRVASSAAAVIICNHCINSAQIAQSNGGLQQFKKDWHEVIKIARKHGKTIVMATPNPILPAPQPLGQLFKPETQKQYVEVMRQVARETATLLVDNYDYFTKLFAGGNTTTVAEVPDGVHPADAGYGRNGLNYTIPFIGQVNHMTSTQNFIPAFSANVAGTDMGAVVVNGNRTGGAMITSDVANRSIRIPVVVDEAGLDVYIAVPLWASGATVASIYVDRVLLTDKFSFRSAFKNGNFMFIHDHEVLVLEDATPGLHFIEIRANATIGFHHIRTRKTRKVKTFKYFAGVNYRQKLIEDFEHANQAPDSVVLFDDIPTPRNFARGYEAEFRCFFKRNTGIVFNGSYAIEPSNSSIVRAWPGYIVGADADGFLTVWENQGGVNVPLLNTGIPSLFVPSDADPVPTEDLSARYQVIFSAPSTTYPNGRLEVIVNGASVGIATLQNPYVGGLLGTWNNTTTPGGDIVRIYSITYLNRTA
jgi:lysophospholipase L1-like esterase